MPLILRCNRLRVDKILVSVAVAGGAGNTVQIDTSATSTGGVSGDFTISITVANNSNRAMYVGVFTGGTNGPDNINGVSSNLDGALTEVGQTTNGSWVNCQVWRLLNPTAGAHTITVDTSSTAQYCGQAVSLYGVDTAGTPNGTVVVSNGTGTSPSATATLGSGGMALGFLCSDGQTGVSVTAGTQLQEVEDIATDIAASTANRLGNGTIAWATTNDGYAVVIVPINALP